MISPSTTDLIARNRANLESRLNQTTPAADKAFNTTLAVMEGMAAKSLYAFAVDRLAANSALTAMGDDLDLIAAEYDVFRDEATACIVAATLPAPDGTEIPLGTKFTGPQGLEYQSRTRVVAPAGASGSGAVLSLVCLEPGTAGNLSAEDTLTIVSPLEGAGRTATVISVTTTGSEREDDESFRFRVLDAERAEAGGATPSDYRTWAQSVPGVLRAYPFTGPYIGSGLTAIPAMRTVYVEAETSIDADGIAPAGLLSQVTDAILNDADTGAPRQLLGFTSDYLYVRSIDRVLIYVKIVGLSVKSGMEAVAQSAVESALSIFLRRFSPFIQGVDPDFDRMDELTSSPITREVQNVIDAYGGTVQNVLFGTSVGTYTGRYQLPNNGKLKLGGITWEAAP